MRMREKTLCIGLCIYNVLNLTQKVTLKPGPASESLQDLGRTVIAKDRQRNKYPYKSHVYCIASHGDGEQEGKGELLCSESLTS